MLILLHGDNLVVSRGERTKLLNSVASKTEVVSLHGPTLTESDLIQNFESSSLFGTSKYIVIDNIFGHKSKTVKVQLLKYLAALKPEQDNSLLWEPKALTTSQLKQVSNFTPKLFKTSAVIFKFFDSLSPGSPQTYLKLYQEACQKDSAEMVFFLLVKHIRSLFLSTDPNSKFPPWQSSKLKKQFQLLGEKQLIALHDSLVLLDLQNKTSQLAGSFQSALQELLVKNLSLRL